MTKEFKVTINELMEEDMRNIFYEATIQMGISEGERIPLEIVEVRERIIKIMFGDKHETK